MHRYTLLLHASACLALAGLPVYSSQYSHLLLNSFIRRSSPGPGPHLVERQLSGNIKNLTVARWDQNNTRPGGRMYNGAAVPVILNDDGFVALLQVGGQSTRFLVDNAAKASFLRLEGVNINYTDHNRQFYFLENLPVANSTDAYLLPWQANLDHAQFNGNLTMNLEVNPAIGQKFSMPFGVFNDINLDGLDAAGILGLGLNGGNCIDNQTVFMPECKGGDYYDLEDGVGMGFSWGRRYKFNVRRSDLSKEELSWIDSQSLWAHREEAMDYFTTYLSYKASFLVNQTAIGLNYIHRFWSDGVLHPLPVIIMEDDARPEHDRNKPPDSSGPKWYGHDWTVQSLIPLEFKLGDKKSLQQFQTAAFLNINLDLISEYTYIERSIAEQLYRTLGGDCDLNMKTMAPEDVWSRTRHKLREGYCSLPCIQNFSDPIGGLFPRPWPPGDLRYSDIHVELPWSNRNIPILPSTLIAHRMDNCTIGKDGRTITTIHSNCTGFWSGTCIGSIQPTIKNPARRTESWKYGQVVFKNAFFQFSAPSRTVYMGYYNQTPWGVHNIRADGLDLNKIVW